MSAPHYLRGVYLVKERVSNPEAFPFSIPALRDLDLTLPAAVTFFVGENGSGKSTLLEAIAALCDFPVSGGGRNDVADMRGPEKQSVLAGTLRPSFRERPRDGYFFRAELLAHFASLLDERRADPDFCGDPYLRYGGRSLHTRSHGEGFLALFLNRMERGLFLMDEPEAALSPQKQLTLLVRIAQLVAGGKTQLIIATHSPILLTYPGAAILSFDGDAPTLVRLEDTAHYQITRGILDAPSLYWRHLVGDARSRDDLTSEDE